MLFFIFFVFHKTACHGCLHSVIDFDLAADIFGLTIKLATYIYILMKIVTFYCRRWRKGANERQKVCSAVTLRVNAFFLAITGSSSKNLLSVRPFHSYIHTHISNFYLHLVSFYCQTIKIQLYGPIKNIPQHVA